MSRINAPIDFRPTINVDYPKGNIPTFEEWFNMVYDGCETDRLLIDVNFTSYLVNNNYAKEPKDIPQLQELIDCLPRNRKYFSICQYDLGVIVDYKDLDVLEFNMSLNKGVSMPLLCQPQPFPACTRKTRLVNFIGSRTHPIRDDLEQFKNVEGYYISYEQHSIDRYCQILSESVFTLCPRGFGANSFRIAEAMQYGSIPVYISDEFIIPYGIDFSQFGILVKNPNAVRDILDSIPLKEIAKMQDAVATSYFKYYTFDANINHIKRCLETEYSKRKGGENTATTSDVGPTEHY